MDQIAALRLLVAVAETGSFTRAAERLSISRAMASRQVQELEAKLGLRLMNRTTRRVSLTEPGTELVERARDVIAGLDDAWRLASAQAAEPVGRLRISAPMSFGVTHIAPLIERFAARHKRLELDLVLNDRFVDLVEEGYDAAIRIGRLADSTLVARRIASTRLVVAAAPSYLKRAGRPKAPGDLTSHECLHYAYASDRETWVFDGAKGRHAVRIRSRITCNNGDALAAMAVAGLGLVREPDFILGPDIAAGRLSEVLQDYAGEPIGIYAVHPSTRHVPLKVRAFVDFLSEQHGGRRGWA